MLDNPEQFLSSLPNRPGIYQMDDAQGQVLYIGKAKSLKKRLASYFRATNNLKTKTFMSRVKKIEIIITPDENTAWLLESNLIKSRKPHYNIAFKDDKSFPYLVLSQHAFPRLSVYHGAINKRHAYYFGPFPDRGAVNFIFNLLQKIFKIRVCKDSFMSNRSRPCMLHQVKLCSAPCVGYIDQADYRLQLELARQFLCNKSSYVVEQLTALMDISAAKLAYEQAATYRDQIVSIRKVQAKQAINKTKGNTDIIALITQENRVGINLVFIRDGLVIGNQAYFPNVYDTTLSSEEILTAFISHRYLQDRVNLVVPDKILLNVKLTHKLHIAKIFFEKFGRKVSLSDRVRGVSRQLITMAEANASDALKTHYTAATNYAECLLDFKQTLGLSWLPRQLECFDVSHNMGEAGVASCVVFKEEGAQKKEYRRFNIKTTKIGDDYSALQEALLRRYTNLEQLPDVIMVDGGLGQLNVAAKILQQLNIQKVLLMAIAKGEERKPGFEEIYIHGSNQPLILPPDNLTLRFIQQIRDEAHRFAISGHRRKMVNFRRQSKLENILRVGKVKRIRLLKYFGGFDELQSAGVDELAKVDGISHNLARSIYDYLHA